MRALKSFVKTVGDSYFWPKSKAEFLSLLNRYSIPSGANILEFTRTYGGEGWYRNIGAMQVDIEFEQLIDWAGRQSPARVMEIGTASGATLLAWCRIATKTVISVDLPGGIHGGGYPHQRQPLYKLFTAGRDVRLHLLQKNSQVSETRNEVENILAGEKLDILYIDGDHTLRGVTADFDLWHSLVRPGGFIVFHDIVKHKRNAEVEVDVLWNRLKKDHPHQEFVKSQDQGWAGIGVLQV